MSYNDDSGLIGIIVVVVVIIYAIAAFVASVHVVEKDITIIEKVPVKPFKVVDSDDNMYVIQDQWQLIFDSGNTYAKIKEGNKYHVKVSGVRFPLLGWFPNIIGIDKI